MSRNGSGTYSLPAGNPVVSGTTISSTTHNDTLSDLEAEMTDSLSRSGKGGMTAALRGAAGTVSAPAYAWTDETGSGLYRISAGNIGFAILGTLTTTFDASGITLEGTLEVDTIAEKTSAAGVTIDGLLIKDGGLGTLATVDIDGGTIDGVTIGGASADAGTFTEFTSTGIDDNATETAITIDSDENVGINETTPLARLHVKNGESGGTGGGDTTALLEDSDNAVLTILTGNTAIGAVNFGDTDDNNIGGILYFHSSDSLSFKTNTATQMRITSGGDVYITGDTLRITTTATPASASAVGTTGDIHWDSNYIYVCVATDTWKRAALSTW